MRRAGLLLASVALAVLLASGVALGVTSGQQHGGRSFEPDWMDEPIAPQQEGQLQSALFAGHWTSVTSDERLYYYNPEKVYPAAVAHGARAWNALDTRFNGKGVRLIQVNSNAKATVRIDGIRDCADRSWLAFAAPHKDFPNQLGVNTCALNRQGAKIREHVLTHELGHHLGSGHQRQRLCGRSIMLTSVPCGRERIVLIKPGVRDVRWYLNRWVK
jgi:Dual-action HEIGH metallo-peptidase